MKSDDIVSVLNAIDTDKVRVFRKNVQCACFLSLYRPGHSLESDHADSMGISISSSGKSLVHCFACKFKGTMAMALRALSEYSGRDLSSLISQVSGLESEDPEAIANSVPGYDTPTVRREEEDVLIPEALLEVYSKGTHKKIVARGLELETCAAWDSRWDEEKKRVVFPVRRWSGELVGGVGRTVVGHKIRYWNYWDFQKSRYLFGEHLHGDGPSVIVVEGLLDTMGVWQQMKKYEEGHLWSVMGLLGSEASRLQVRKLAECFEEAVLFFDNDPAGWSGQLKLARELQRFMIVRAVRYPGDDGDPMELVKQGCDVAKLILDSDLIVG